MYDYNLTCDVIIIIILSIGVLEFLDVQKTIKKNKNSNKLPCQTYYVGTDSHFKFEIDEIEINANYIRFKDEKDTCSFKINFASNVDYYSYQEDGWMLSNDSKQYINYYLELCPSILYGFHVDLAGNLDKLYVQMYSSKIVKDSIAYTKNLKS